MEEQDDIQNVIHVITIVVDPDGVTPRLDIGNMSPLYAHTLLQACADALYDCIPEPDVVWGGDVINEYDYAIDDDDED